MSKRKALSKRTRFEVFKRDSFTCQYCGGKAPEIILVIDHIQPVAGGGDNDLLNLITSCENCNAGKSDKLLSDSSAVSKSHNQAALLQERRQQIEMLAEWHQYLREFRKKESDIAIDHLRDVSGWGLNDHGRRKIESLVSKFSLQEVLQAMDTAADQYFKFSSDQVTKESFENAFSKLEGICRGKRLERDNPDLAALLLCRNIAKKRLFLYYQPSPEKVQQITNEIQTAMSAGVPIEAIKQVCCRAQYWNRFFEEMEALYL